LVEEGNTIKDLTFDDEAMKKMEGLQGEAKGAWVACEEELREMEEWRGKIEAEVQRETSEKSSVDHMTNLAKYQRRQSGGRSARS
jgi:hypothetical protein